MTGSLIQIHSDLITCIQKAFIHTRSWQTHTDIQQRKQQGHVLPSYLFNYTELHEAEKRIQQGKLGKVFGKHTAAISN